MPPKIFKLRISVFHHRHGSSMSAVSRHCDTSSFWSRHDAHDPNDGDEFISNHEILVPEHMLTELKKGGF